MHQMNTLHFWLSVARYLRLLGPGYQLKKQMAKSKADQLDSIKAEILMNNITPELATTATQLVFGDGNPDADMVFIGEAPGKNEDLQGLPFVGAAGRFLNEMLDSIGLSREDIYITNIVKYRPPGNRDPSSEEKLAFLPYLRQQLEVIKPKLVVTLGRHSMDSLLPGLQISSVHGQPKRYEGQVYLPLFHPAAALYNGSMRATLMQDFAKIPSILAKI
jgi:uracil-DNA glycosylase